MTRLTIIIGLLLMLVGAGLYFGLTAAEGDWVSPTALIPAAAGLPIFLLGLLALRDSWRKHAMHVVSLLALLGLLLPVGRLGMKLAQGAQVKPTILTSLLLMAVLSGILLLACIRSFVRARLTRSTAS